MEERVAVLVLEQPPEPRVAAARQRAPRGAARGAVVLRVPARCGADLLGEPPGVIAAPAEEEAALARRPRLRDRAPRRVRRRRFGDEPRPQRDGPAARDRRPAPEPRRDGLDVRERRREADQLRRAAPEPQARQELLVRGAAVRVADQVELVDRDGPQAARRPARVVRRAAAPPPPRARVRRREGLAVQQAQRGLGRAAYDRPRHRQRRARRVRPLAAVDDRAAVGARAPLVVVAQRPAQRPGLLGDEREERQHVQRHPALAPEGAPEERDFGHARLAAGRVDGDDGVRAGRDAVGALEDVALPGSEPDDAGRVLVASRHGRRHLGRAQGVGDGPRFGCIHVGAAPPLARPDDVTNG